MRVKVTLAFALLWILPEIGLGQLDIKLEEWPVRAYEIFEENGEAEGTQAFEEGMKLALAQGKHAIYLELLHDLGAAYTYIMGEPDAVISKLSEVYHLPFVPQSVDEYKFIAAIYVSLGYTYSLDLGQYAEALIPFKQAYKVFEEDLQVRTAYRALYIEKQLGNIYTRLGDYPAAEIHLQTAIDILEREKEYDQAASVCSDLGLLYQNWEKNEQALDAYNRGLNYQQLGAYSHTLLLINYADCLLEAELEREALQKLEFADKLLENASAEEIPANRRLALQAGIYEKEALIQSDIKDFNQATKSIEKAIQATVAYYGTNNRREVAKLHNKHGQILANGNRFAAAIEQHQAALQCVIPSYQPESDNELPTADDFFAENVILESLEHLASTYSRWFKEKNNTELLQRALDCHESMYDVEKHLQQIYRYDDSKLFNLEESRDRSEKAIQIAHQLYRHTGKGAFLYQAFTFAERSRSRLLREAFQRTQANDLSGLSPQLQQEEEDLLRAVSTAEEERYRLISEQAPDSLVRQTELQLLQARNHLHEWVQNLQTSAPKYYQLRYAEQVPSLEQLRQMLDGKEQLIEYFVGSSHIYIFRLDQSGFTLHETVKPANLNQRVLEWRRSIEAYQNTGVARNTLINQYQQEAYNLYQNLLSSVLPATQDIDQLLIISSGILDLIPFEALLTSTVDSQTPLSNYPYLLKHYAISYTYSASLQWSLFQLERKGEQKAAFAPSFDAQSGWAPLTCSADMLQRTFASTGGSVHTGTEATIAAFQRLAPQYRLLHLATHAQANPEYGDFSYIVFSDGQGGYDSLFAKDLYLYDLEAELVILSACETALGTLYNSEGVISLARAFHYAGARSVLTTLWRINEGANCSLLEEFYAALDDGEDKRQALRTAKLQYLANTDARGAHPVYWAGFQLLGNPRAMEASTPWHWYLLGSLGLLLIFAMFRQFSKRKETVLT